MNYYIDITVKPDSEMRENLLMNKVYTKLHLALSSLKSMDIGVSFPNCRVIVGSVIRIHASAERLDELQSKSWLGGQTVLAIEFVLENRRICLRRSSIGS